MVDNIPSLLLPSELKHHIADLCSRSSLVSLARTHTAYQREAEQALYRDLTIITSDESHLKCMNTLATNSDKAAFVLFLTIECISHSSNTDRAITYLFQALRNMHSLSDFRIKRGRPHKKFGVWMEELGKILCEGHFQLKTLYFDDTHHLSRIIKSQTELEILGIYGNQIPTKNLLKALKHVQNAQSLLPIVFMFQDQSLSLVFESIIIFPAFYSIERYATIPQILAKSIHANQGSVVRADIDKVDQLSIFVVDCADMSTIITLAKNMAVIAPQIARLGISFEHECEIPVLEMKEVLSLFSNLRRVYFSHWPSENGGFYTRTAAPKISREFMMAHVKEWRAACPKLFVVKFPNGSIVRCDGDDRT